MIDIKVKSYDKRSDEYLAATKLATLFETYLPKTAKGKIILCPNAYLLGQKVKDIDIVVIGKLEGCKLSLKINEDFEDVFIDSFITTIEYKQHDIRNVEYSGTNFYVSYVDHPKHNVTNQSMQQAVALRNLLKDSIASSHVSNIIWFDQITKKDLESLLSKTFQRKTNVITNDVSIDQFFEVIYYQNNREDVQQKNIKDIRVSDFLIDSTTDRFLNTFYEVQSSAGEFTRKKVETITNQVLKKKISTEEVIRGKAGTGKTHLLLIEALNFSENENKRVVMLTYNNVLAADLNRILSLTRFRDNYQDNGLKITTIHKFIFSYCSALGVLKPDQDFIDYYDAYLKELIEYIDSGLLSKEELKTTFADAYYDLVWDYVFIDEAQDCTQAELDFFIKLMGKNNVFVSEGPNQNTRGKSIDWTYKNTRTVKRLKSVLRQKQNIISFVSRLLDSVGYETDMSSEGAVPGGRVIIKESSEFNLVDSERLVKQAQLQGCVNYDILILVPPRFVSSKQNQTSFLFKEGLDQIQRKYWDGTNPVVRNTLPISDELRIVQYDSARGIEGWTVECLSLDELYDYKWNEFSEELYDSDLMTSFDEQRRDYANRWLMIALTRAIDTLYITINNPNSRLGKLIKELSMKNEFIEYIKGKN